MPLDGYNVEIDETDQHHVVLVIRALRLIVLGRTLDEAHELARAAIASRGQDADRRPAQSAMRRGRDDNVTSSMPSPAASHAA